MKRFLIVMLAGSISLLAVGCGLVNLPTEKNAIASYYTPSPTANPSLTPTSTPTPTATATPNGIPVTISVADSVPNGLSTATGNWTLLQAGNHLTTIASLPASSLTSGAATTVLYLNSGATYYSVNIETVTGTSTGLQQMIISQASAASVTSNGTVDGGGPGITENYISFVAGSSSVSVY